ncbi:MAG: COX15/CtaA family protein [Pseudomonadales bacterium]
MTDSNRVVVAWLAIVCATVFAMIVVGGVTRLTESGLSMVDWRPIMGIVPPTSDEEWQSAFEAYQQYPQYMQVNRDMDLSGFKRIFYWEYGHRVLGRVIGIVFFVPFILLWWCGKIEPRLIRPLGVALALGGAQGLLGWYMVKSGLIDIPRVSHYRLAAHLLLAMLIFAYLYWLILSILEVRREAVSKHFRNFVFLLAGLTTVQLLYGAFTAGIRAGYGYNTFPLMNGQWIADAVFFMQPWWINLFESGATIQFVHRWIGTLLLCLSFGGWILGRRYPSRVRWASAGLFGTLLVQYAIGVLTLVQVVPIGLASLHQAFACAVILALVYLVYVTLPDRAT